MDDMITNSISILKLLLESDLTIITESRQNGHPIQSQRTEWIRIRKWLTLHIVALSNIARSTPLVLLILLRFSLPSLDTVYCWDHPSRDVDVSNRQEALEEKAKENQRRHRSMLDYILSRSTLQRGVELEAYLQGSMQGISGRVRLVERKWQKWEKQIDSKHTRRVPTEECKESQCSIGNKARI